MEEQPAGWLVSWLALPASLSLLTGVADCRLREGRRSRLLLRVLGKKKGRMRKAEGALLPTAAALARESFVSTRRANRSEPSSVKIGWLPSSGSGNGNGSCDDGAGQCSLQRRLKRKYARLPSSERATPASQPASQLRCSASPAAARQDLNISCH